MNRPSAAPSIPLSAPEVAGNEWQYVKECLDSGWVSSAGSFVERFELEIASYLRIEKAVATSSGTSALHIALLVAGVEPEDEVLVSTLTFIAPVNAIRYAGAWPVFVDAESEHWQFDSDKAARYLRRHCRREGGQTIDATTGRRVSALLAVDVLGHPCDMEAVGDLAREFDLIVVEDATESLGASYRGRPAGTLADIGCLSFNGNKLITTGGGGALVTDSGDWARRARYLTTQARDDPVEYVHGEIGYNYRLSNLAAAVGCAQLESIGNHLAAKRRNAAVYTAAVEKIPGILPMPEADWAKSAFWLYTILVDPTAYGMDSRGLLRALERDGIETRPLWQPLHLSAPHIHCPATTCEVSEELFRRALSLPSSVGLTEGERARVIAAIKSHASRDRG